MKRTNLGCTILTNEAHVAITEHLPLRKFPQDSTLSTPPYLSNPGGNGSSSLLSDVGFACSEN